MPVPLDKKNVDSPCGQVPSLDPRWRVDMNCVLYSSPPLASADAATVEQWAEKLDFIEEDFNMLLQLPHDKFWCQVIFEESVLPCVDSYLRYAPRSYDVVYSLPNEFTRAYSPYMKVQEKHSKIHRLAFLVCLRMATHKESKEHFLTSDVFGEILYENFIFDIPKLMDLAVLYGASNGPLVGKMIENIFRQQPKYHHDLQMVVPTILQVFQGIQKKCCDDSESGIPAKLGSTRRRQVLTDMPGPEFQDLVFYLLDTSYTLRRFLDVYPSATHAFLQESFPVLLAQFYDTVIDSLSEAFLARDWPDEGLRDLLLSQLHTAQANMLHAFRSIMQTGCIQPILENSDSAVCEEHVENYFDIMSHVIAERRFLGHLESLFPFSEDSDLLTQSSSVIDETRLAFLKEAFREAFSVHGKSKHKKKAESKHSGLSFAHFAPDPSEPSQEDAGMGGASAAVPSVSTIELQSLTTSVKDILPTLGDGFVECCLLEYGYDAECVINALLEDKLPDHLQKLDRNMPAQMTTEYVDPSEMAESESMLSRRKNVFDNDEFDIFNRADVDATRIHVGKADPLGYVKATDFLNDKSAIREVRARYDKYTVAVDIVEIDEAAEADYDDEYDDTYDTNQIGADDADSADELSVRRPFTVPRVLGGASRSMEKQRLVSDSDESEEEGKKPDHFCQDPAAQREAYAQRRASQMGSGGGKSRAPPKKVYDTVGGAKGEGQSKQVLRNRAFKEKNKGGNRKAQADRKRRV